MFPASVSHTCRGGTGLLMARTTLLFVLLLGILQLDTTYGFNFDFRAPLKFEGPPGSLFGFSVAQHREGNTDWALIGAPEAQTAQAGVQSGGAVYKCPVSPLSSQGPCEQVIFDSEGSSNLLDKSNQWFGATVESSKNGTVLACAPRLVWLHTSSSSKEREPTGVCYVASQDFSVISNFSPCQTTDPDLFGFDQITHCQAGFSAQIPKDNSVLVMGAPGSYYLQGQVYAQSLSDLTDVRSTSEATAVFDNSYQGFSMALGDFNNDGVEDYVVGSPRGDSLLGSVSIYDRMLNVLATVTGDQLVSYFGNSVEAVDVNGDGLDDLIVGAPMHTDRRTAIEKWEAGQVYIYLQTAPRTFAPPQLLTGSVIRARFGYSVSSIGDANQDGFNDIAVGAPFDGDDQKGRVYIYHGSSTGLESTPAQVISPSDLGMADTTTFGFSLEGGQDMDQNSYPDLLVGAESSDKAVLIRARPVVLLEAELTLDPIGINLENRTHRLPDGTMVTSFLALAKFSYSGIHLPDSIAISYTLTLDSNIASSPRALVTPGDTSRVTKRRELDVGNEFIDTFTVYVVNTIQDKLTPIAVTLDYALDQDESALQPYEILPIINKEAVSSETKQVYIQNNCANNVCIPDLQVSATSSVASIVIGDTQELTLDVTIVNDGEDAFQSQLFVHYPQGVQFVRLERKLQMDLSVTCTEDPDIRVITCDTGNPLIGHYTMDFGLTMSTMQVSGDADEIEFYLMARSENSEEPNTLSNNQLNMTVDVTVEINLKLLSASDPGIVTYPALKEGEAVPPFPAKNASETDIGPALTHTYEVRNAGPSTAGEIEMEITWPQKNQNGEYLFYLLGMNTADGINCQITEGSANPEGVKLEDSTKAQLLDSSSLNVLSSGGGLRRRRRDAAEVGVAQAQTDPIYCEDGGCVRIACTVSQLKATESKVVRLLGRFWKRTFMTSDPAQMVVVSVASTATARVLTVPYNVPLPTEFSASTKASTTIAAEELQQTAGSIAWWIIVVSVLGGIILLLIIILGLWKCGFFERKKLEKNYEQVPTADQEKAV